ncbi:unnamed protein product [Caenorhabditis bovis]|uniref:Homeobox protein cut-like n=1 Tax=Caenorhabditis bovis TaxID=2654633 RepID=A0A8S1EPV7_9PELO|nr:unnamed protein product [Caenorhabditis bovis]
MEAVANAWETVDWDRLQTRIEAEISALGARQDDSEERRKRLVEESNAYRERTDKETRKPAIPLIKAFQQEFDGLIARSQAAESALIDICSQITNLPDPKSVLKGAEAWKSDAEKTIKAVEEREQLRRQLEETRSELAELQNHDVELRKLKSIALKRETEHEKLIESAIDEVERRTRDEFEKQLEEMNLKNEKMRIESEILEKKVNDLEARNRDTQRKLDVAKLAVSQNETFESEQLSIAVKDLADANLRIVCLEEKLAEMTAELNKSNEQHTHNGIADIAALGGLMIEKDEQISRLQEEKKEMQKRYDEEIKRWREKVVKIEKEQARQKTIIEELKTRLESQGDYDAIKKELRLLREIEFGTADTNSETSEHVGEPVETLDKLLSDKNRRLQNENASLRVLNENLKGEPVTVTLAEEPEIKESALPKVKAAPVKEDEKSLDLLSLLRKIKSTTTTTTTPTSQDINKTVKTPTHTITTCALPPPVVRKNVMVAETDSDETDLKLASSSINVDPSEIVESKKIAKMQARIAENVRNLGLRPLNTTEIAKQCKRLMLAYNIGQRLFAKHVMNQSQGSLSELLSKPRHWSKLTDKGREAFRRIYGWLSDEVAINLLCSLSPRRNWPATETVPHPLPESMWESSIGFLEASPPVEELKENPLKAQSAREDQYRNAERARPTVVTNGGVHPNRSSRWRHDDIPKEKIMSIFQNELAKLKEQTVTKSSGSSSSSPRKFTGPTEFTNLSAVDRVMRQRINTGLVPITQAQFDEFAHIDTEQLVRQVKEFLMVHSISQRQFGEYVLGLSQGSVSDLLARPKSWNLLTQKGREPFIRMKLFMDEVNDCVDDKQPQVRVLSDDSELAIALASILKGANGAISPEKEQVATIFENIEVKKEPISEIDMIMEMESGSNLEGLVKYVDNTGEEILDTIELVRRVRKILDDNGVSYRVFGDFYLKCSPNLCAELLIRTRPYEQLKPFERLIAMKMKMFLTDRDAILLLIEKEAAREGTKDRLDALFRENRPVKRKVEPEPVDDDWEPNAKKPIQRTVISDVQKDILRFVFVNEPHPGQDICEMLANRLDMNVRTVQNWFHNHRTRTKAREREGKVYSDAIPTNNAVISPTWRSELQTMLNNFRPGDASSSQRASFSRSPSSTVSGPLDQSDIVSSIISNIKRDTKAKMGVISQAPPKTLADIIAATPKSKLAIKKPATSGQLDKLENQREVVGLRSRCDIAENLVAKLENDLASAIGCNTNTETLGTLDMLRSSDTAPSASLVPILTSQRNRLHEKVSQLEEMLAAEKTRQMAVQSEIEKVRSDNVKLNEKIRFLQGGSYNPSQSVVIEDDAYETPFRKFSSQERNNRLQLHDRATLQLGRAILASSKSRMIFFFYLLFLHLLIMMVLYKFAFDQASLRDQETECEYKFHQHMAESHKGN